MPEKRLAQQEVANHLVLTTRQVHNLVKLGMPKHGTNGKVWYLWSECLPWYVAYQRQDAVARLSGGDIKKSQERKMAAEAETAELELARMKENLVERGYLRDQLERICQKLRAKLLSTSGRHAAKGVGLLTEAEVQAFLDDVVRDQLEAVSTVGGDTDLDEEGE